MEVFSKIWGNADNLCEAEKIMELAPSIEAGAENSDPVDLAQSVRDWAESAFQQHYLDILQGPDLSFLKPYVRKKDLVELTEKEWDIVYKNNPSFKHEEPKNWRQRWGWQISKALPKRMKRPKINDWKEAYTWLRFLEEENTSERIHNGRMKSFKKKISKMSLEEVISEYPMFLRFNPERYCLPESADTEYWVKRVNTFLDLKCKNRNVSIPVHCYSSIRNGENELILYRVSTMIESDLSKESFDNAIEEFNKSKSELKPLDFFYSADAEVKDKYDYNLEFKKYENNSFHKGDYLWDSD